MRKIKFRYWNEQTKACHYSQEQVLACLSQQVTGLYNHESDGCYFEQFSGLLDKNGREIYEGDKVKFPSGKERIIVFDHCSFGYELSDGEFVSMSNASRAKWELEVIGNIHENPELLK